MKQQRRLVGWFVTATMLFASCGSEVEDATGSDGAVISEETTSTSPASTTGSTAPASDADSFETTSTEATTSTAELTTTTEDAVVEDGTSEEFAKRLVAFFSVYRRDGDPRFADLLTPELREQNAFGLTFGQFMMFTSLFNPSSDDSTCAYENHMVICSGTFEDDFTKAVGFTGEFSHRYGFENNLIASYDGNWNGGAAFAGFFQWLADAYPDNSSCDFDGEPPNDYPDGALVSEDGIRLGQSCRDAMVELGAEYAQSSFYITPPPPAS